MTWFVIETLSLVQKEGKSARRGGKKHFTSDLRYLGVNILKLPIRSSGASR